MDNIVLFVNAIANGVILALVVLVRLKIITVGHTVNSNNAELRTEIALLNQKLEYAAAEIGRLKEKSGE